MTETTSTNNGMTFMLIVAAIIIGVSIASCVLSKKYREQYGTTEMSRIRGTGLFMGFVLILIGTSWLIEAVVTPGAVLEDFGAGALVVAGGSLLSVLCCIGILRRYSGGQAATMIFRLFIVGLGVYMVFSWILTVLFFWLFAKLLPRRKYVLIETD